MPSAVKVVTNRGTMLDVVKELDVRGASVSTPAQIVLRAGGDAEREVRAADMETMFASVSVSASASALEVGRTARGKPIGKILRRTSSSSSESPGIIIGRFSDVPDIDEESPKPATPSNDDEDSTIAHLRAALKQIERAGMKPPFLAKALTCDGSAHSHHVAIIHDEYGIGSLYRGEVQGIELPCVLQQYVNHGGFLFKVYVVGDSVSVSTRRSLPDFPPTSAPAWNPDRIEVHEVTAATVTALTPAIAIAEIRASSPQVSTEGSVGVLSVPRVSRFDPDDDTEQISEDGGSFRALHGKSSLDNSLKAAHFPHHARLTRTELANASSVESLSDLNADSLDPPYSSAYLVQPSQEVLREIGLELRSKLGLDIFNFDLLRRKDDPDGELLVVDINYFPGISKMPGYLDAFCDFLAHRP
jgi:hypothetical protein